MNGRSQVCQHRRYVSCFVRQFLAHAAGSLTEPRVLYDNNCACSTWLRRRSRRRVRPRTVRFATPPARIISRGFQRLVTILDIDHADGQEASGLIIFPAVVLISCFGCSFPWRTYPTSATSWPPIRSPRYAFIAICLSSSFPEDPLSFGRISTLR